MSYALATAMAAVLLGLSSAFTAITGDVDVGVVAGAPGGLVLDAVVNGPAWNVGIRVGQRVLSLTSADQPGGWSIQTSDGAATHRLTAEDANAPLRLSAMPALVAFVLGLVALRDARQRRRRSELASSVALVLAAGPIMVVGSGPLATVVLALSAAAPAVWIARWRPLYGVRGAAFVVAAVGAGMAGAVAWTTRADAVRLLAMGWVVATGLLTLVTLAIGTAVTPTSVAAGITALDGAVVGFGVLAVAALSVLGVPLPWAAAAVLAPVVLYAAARRPVRRGLDRIVLADLREQAAIRATENERARMAREIHDDPLQALAGAIRQLEGPEPDADRARESLRDVATRLRDVATALHPPVLDDLGLVPAIEAAARHGDTAAIEVAIEDRTGYGSGGRPPADVELAAFRVVQEAIANAVRHAGPSKVAVRGRVAAQRLEIEVLDDGVGFSEAAAQAALRQGRLGVASMRQRAAAVGADFEIGRRPEGGTKVAFRWPA